MNLMVVGAYAKGKTSLLMQLAKWGTRPERTTVSFSFKTVLANSVGPDEMLHSVAFHLDLFVCQSIPVGVSSIRKNNMKS